MTPLRIIATVAGGAVTAAPLLAQTVQGRVLGLPGDAPLAGALVTLVDMARREITRTASSQSGGFGLTASGAGKYVVVVRQIGYQAWYSAPFELAKGATYPLTLRIEAVPYTLPTITVEARRPRCGVHLDEDGVIPRLLDIAGTALALAGVTASSDSIAFSTAGYRARLTPALEIAESTGTGTSRLADWPIRSADPDSLRAYGFVRATSVKAGPIYYGPDARVLFSDWFLASHCFRVEEKEGGMVPVRFTPQRRPGAGTVDIEGRLVIDGRSLELLRFEFIYVGLPRWVPKGKAGGMVWMRRLHAGSWVPHAWRIRAPVPLIALGRTDPRLDSWVEEGGRVTAVRGAKGELDSTLTGELLRGAE